MCKFSKCSFVDLPYRTVKSQLENFSSAHEGVVLNITCSKLWMHSFIIDRYTHLRYKLDRGSIAALVRIHCHSKQRSLSTLCWTL